MARGDLRLPATMGQLFQRFLERQRHLPSVPATSQPGFHRLTPGKFHSEAREAQRAWPLRRRVVLIIPEAIAGLFLTTARTQHRPARRDELLAPKLRHPPVVQRELLTFIHLKKRLCHSLVSFGRRQKSDDRS